MTRGEDGFLSRWARRKQDVRETEEREAALAPQPDDSQALAREQALADPEQRDVPPDEIKNIQVLETWMDGRRVFAA